MIENLEITQITTFQNKYLTQNPTKNRSTNKNDSTIIEPLT